MNQYRSNNLSTKPTLRNPFDEPDDFDLRFGNRNQSRISDRVGTQDEEEALSAIQQRIGHTENESLESTRRALRLLNETEEVGVTTAAELVRQGEQLRNIDERLDEVDHTLTATQRNINSLKSIFGNLFTRTPKPAPSKPSTTNAKMTSSSSFSGTGSASAAPNRTMSGEAPPTSKAQFAVITGSDREQELNANLDEMSKGLSNLTRLAREMGSELDRQDPLISRISNKAELTKGKIDVQNDQMKKILK